MTEPQYDALPQALARTLQQFRGMKREDKMTALLAWSRKLEPLPEHIESLDRAPYTVPECQTRVDLFPELRADGTMHFYAAVSARHSPTIAAVLAIVFAAVNDQPPAVTMALPMDLGRWIMKDIGLGAREAGISAMIQRLVRYATSVANAAPTLRAPLITPAPAPAATPAPEPALPLLPVPDAVIESVSPSTPPMTITITVRQNGSLGISAEDAANIRLVDHAGNVIPPRAGEGKPMSLCRCGLSKVKPFCDGAHKAGGFIDPVPAEDVTA